MLQATGHGFQAFQTIVENVTDMKTNWDCGGFYRVEWDRAQLRITFFGPRKRQTNRHLAWRPATRKMIYKEVSKINVIERNTQLCATTHFNGTLKSTVWRRNIRKWSTRHCVAVHADWPAQTEALQDQIESDRAVVIKTCGRLKHTSLCAA